MGEGAVSTGVSIRASMLTI